MRIAGDFSVNFGRQNSYYQVLYDITSNDITFGQLDSHPFLMTLNRSPGVTSYANVCLVGCKTDGNHKKDNRMITEFGQ